MTTIPAPTARPTPVVLPATKAALWLVGTAIIALALYYFIGVDQGATSVFGNDMHIHEFVHDARHFLGFHCTNPDGKGQSDVEKRLILRGVLAGALAGLLAFVFARIFAEPQIQTAIDYETGRDAAQAMLDKAAGLPTEPAGPDLFTRTIQATLGIGVGMIFFGIAMGALFALAYTICLGRVGNLQPRTLALLVAAGGFLGVYLVPFVKYPANPPSIGHPDTITDRGGLYLLMVLSSVIFLVAAAWLGQRLRTRWGNWNASLFAGAAFVVTIGIVMAILPSLGHLALNEQQFGHQATETPLPLTDANGTIVYPGFPADVLFNFRLYSIIAQLILWVTIGLVFAPQAERLLHPHHRSVPAQQIPATG